MVLKLLSIPSFSPDPPNFCSLLSQSLPSILFCHFLIFMFPYLFLYYPSSLLFHLSSLFLSFLLPCNIHIFRYPVLPTKSGFPPFTAMGKSTICAHIPGTFLSTQWIADSDIESKGKEMKCVLYIPHSKSS